VVGLALPDAPPAQWSKRQSVHGLACTVMMQFRLQVCVMGATDPQSMPPPTHVTEVLSVNPEVAVWEAEEKTVNPHSNIEIMIRPSVVMNIPQIRLPGPRYANRAAVRCE